VKIGDGKTTVNLPYSFLDTGFEQQLELPIPLPAPAMKEAAN